MEDENATRMFDADVGMHRNLSVSAQGHVELYSWRALQWPKVARRPPAFKENENATRACNFELPPTLRFQGIEVRA